jgi:hypothetical protein
MSAARRQPRSPLGWLVQEWIDRTGAKPADLAKIFDVAESSVNAWRTRQHPQMSPVHRARLAKLLDLAPSTVEDLAARSAGFRTTSLPDDVELAARMPCRRFAQVGGVSSSFE